MLKKAIHTLIGTFLVAGLPLATFAQDVPPVVPDNGSVASNTRAAVSNSGARDVFTLTTSMSDNATLVSAIKACGLEAGLRNQSSITVFAPNNAAFAKLPPGLVDQLLKPENAQILSKIINYHIVAGNHTQASMREAIKAGRGRAEYTTLSGNKIIATIEENKIRLTDDGNNACYVTQSDIKATNGLIHVVDKVVLPR
ncbi:MAG: fasciclin domain-containing protein [Chitinophagaceae bacterium]|nr:MAG: fasciclin domain-containing protein [Chitinophagaceae bacterium]